MDRSAGRRCLCALRRMPEAMARCAQGIIKDSKSVSCAVKGEAWGVSDADLWRSLPLDLPCKDAFRGRESKNCDVLEMNLIKTRR